MCLFCVYLSYLDFGLEGFLAYVFGLGWREFGEKVKYLQVVCGFGPLWSIGALL